MMIFVFFYAADTDLDVLISREDLKFNDHNGEAKNEILFFKSMGRKWKRA